MNFMKKFWKELSETEIRKYRFSHWMFFVVVAVLINILIQLVFFK